MFFDIRQMHPDKKTLHGVLYYLNYNSFSPRFTRFTLYFRKNNSIFVQFMLTQ